MRPTLPIDDLIPAIRSSLRGQPNLVVQAEPGAGKTTRVPPALLELVPGEVLVLEPRRIAARLAARRVAAELGERPGQTAGYQVRFESVVGRSTRLRFLTEGVLTRRMISDPRLGGVDAVVLDEFHERHLEGDLAFALLRRLQTGARPDLKLIVMSATLDAAPISSFLGGCPVLRAEGRLHPVEIRYTPHGADPLEQQVAAALQSLLREGLDGDVLIFLPGAAEIRRAQRSCGPILRGKAIDLVTLHGDLPPREQDRAVEPGPRPKVILSTNVAESSLTIEGVTAVIDSGLARVASDSPWTGLPVLRVTRISQASADQRAGRAGRTRPGQVVRLFPEATYHRLESREAPEITRRELSQLCLDLSVLGVTSPERIPWLTPPPAESLAAAAELLERLGAWRPGPRLTAAGRRMAKLPLHPRLARLVVEAADRGAGADGCALAALLSAGERLPPGTENQTGPSDLLVLLESPWSSPAKRLVTQIRRIARVPSTTSVSSDDALLIALLRAFPDRVARRRTEHEFLLAAGGSARLSPASVVRRHELIVAADVEERPDHGLPLVRLASGVEPEWLFDLFPERIEERHRIEWNRSAERVEATSALLYDRIVIEESRTSDHDSKAASRLLAEQAIEAGIDRFIPKKDLDVFLERAAFAAQHAQLPTIGETELRETLASLCDGLRGFRELSAATRGGSFLRALRARFTSAELRLLGEVAPERIRLPSGHRARVHYTPGQPPWLASRLQDFFGLSETPRVARGQVPLVLHLLAPNQRPVQTTTDLAGFWQRLYPQVRRELRRRYPKHAWPENPLSNNAR